mgnify:CR=1 FL=1
MVDLVTFGETMLRLSPPGDGRLETTPQFDVTVGGAESNVAAVASRLGQETVWLSKLPDSPLGRRVAGELRRDGIEPMICWTDEGRVGTYYLESGDPPRGTDVVYDRAGSAVTTVQPEELDTEAITSADIFHTSGITPALSDATAATTAKLLSIAGRATTTVSFDLNYRSKLWSHAGARETLEPLLGDVDLLFAPRRDTESILGIDAAAPEMARDLARTYGIQTVVVTMGSDGALALHEGERFEQSVYPASDRRPIGTGDAFVGGFLASLLETDDVDTALSWGSATAALKRSIPGDVATVTSEEVQAVIDGSTPEISR